MKNKGFTLIETLVALGIFGALIVVIMRVFAGGFASQKRILEMQAVQRDGAYIMEVISREIRMAQNVNTAASYGNYSQSQMTFIDHTGNPITYCRALATGACAPGGDYFSMGGKIVNSDDAIVKRLMFTYSASPDVYARAEPMVTVNLEMESKKDPNIKIDMQSSVAMRLYYLHM